jgi:hypothetical protein
MRLCHNSGISFILLIGFLIAWPGPACADQVILTYGDRISGRIVSISRDAVRIESPASGTIEIQRKYVEQINTDEPRIVDLISGERVIGQLIAAEGKTVIIRSSILGDRRISLDAIDAVRDTVGSSHQSAVSPAGSPSSLAQIRGKGSGAPVSLDQMANPVPAQQPKPIGQKPEDVGDIRKVFLRQSAVLLHPGQVEVEGAFNYQHTQAFATILNAKFRQFQVPLDFRAGLFNRGEGFMAIPVAYARQDLAFADNVISHKKFGIGDATVGLNYELASETATRPDIIASVALGVPTGSKPNEQGLSLGTGHWMTTVGLQFVKIADPVALFGGVSYGHQFQARYFLDDAVHKVDPGEIGGYNFGFGFAVNENISLSAQVSGSYQSCTKADGKKIFGSSKEPASLRSALTYRYSRGTYVEPSITIGLDQDTPDFAIGFSLTRRFGK